MGIGARRLCALIGELVDADGEVRRQAAERVCDWARAFSGREARLVAEVLATAAAAEESGVCLEAQLNALGDLDTENVIEGADLSPLGEISAARVGVEHEEHLRDLAPYFAR
jgi:hypothetical protein